MEYNQQFSQEPRMQRPEPMMPPAPSLRRVKIIFGTLIVLLFVLGALAFYFYQESLKAVQSSAATADSYKQSVAQVVDAVGKLVILPTGEEPTLATITDTSKLADQPFFANAEVGDKVLIYTNAKKAILYSPTKNKIIDIAPINLAPQIQQGISNPPVTPGTNAAVTGVKFK